MTTTYTTNNFVQKSKYASYLQSILTDHSNRHSFASKQVVSNSVQFETVYNDDATMCFNFNVIDDPYISEIEVYSNSNSKSVTGYVSNAFAATDHIEVVEALRKHFSFKVVELSTNGTGAFTAL
jgi:hypothetical protein|tara:strand:+ start:2149 stop:2520 length:372 start_codon:yes stop_codon:yes gene_type:complete